MPKTKPAVSPLAKKNNGAAKKNGGAAKRALSGDVEAADPTSPEALLALPKEYADAPDMPVEVAVSELGSLARLAKSQETPLAKVGIGADRIALAARFGRRLAACEQAWQDARAGVPLSPKERKLLAEAEELDNKMVAGGRWACRKDATAQKELDDIAEGSGLVDTVDDLASGVAFWKRYAAKRKDTDITDQDLARAAELETALKPAAEKEEADVAAAQALELRNRCFWAADELAKDMREGGRYAFRKQPKIAAKFTSRYRAALDRRARKNKKAKAAVAAQAKANGATPA